MKKKSSTVETSEGFKYLYGRELVSIKAVMHRCTTILEENYFAEIITPAVLEYGLVVGPMNRPVSLKESDSVFNFVTVNGGHLALSYENTLPVCKFYIEKFAHKRSKVKRFYYISSHFRNEKVVNKHTRFRQFYQVGWELLGGSKESYIHDAIIMGDKILCTLGINHFIKVSDVNIISDIFMKMPFTREEKRELLQLLDDRHSLKVEQFLNTVQITSAQKELLLFLVRNTNDVDTLLTSFLDLLRINGITEAIPRVQKVCEIVCKLQKTCKRIEVDFNLVRSIGFYSGIIFQYYTAHSSNESGGGGEYDRIVKSLGGPNTKACGGAFGLERLIHDYKHI